MMDSIIKNSSNDHPQLQEFFQSKLIDLGEDEILFSGIFTPESERDEKKIGITDQFLNDASVYDATYSNSGHFRALFDLVFRHVTPKETDRPLILDIGSGSGANSVVPILQLYPNATIVATDLSPQLLAILRKYIRENGLEAQVFCVCTDAMKNHFKAEMFDIVIGSAILHHLLDPVDCLSAAKRTLRPGGIAIFFEPFEGFAMLRMAFELILKRIDADHNIDPLVQKKVLQALATDYKVRAGTDKSGEHFLHMDDKWLFTRSYLEMAKIKSGFDAMTIVPLHGPEEIFRRLAVVLLRMGGGFSENDLPAWAWEYIDLLDNCISNELKSDLVLEGGVIFHRKD